ncbi:MAG: VOC family protein [Nocardioidaceae bacterium]|nr:VOC family protein [Nocardioidaceae bacterium]NUS51851.1 VOC family protein [Nocardioidaceae bacterium]
MGAESAFWAGVLDGTVRAEDDWHTVAVDGAPRVGVQLAPDHVPPQWPDGAPQQIHLDLWVEDFPEAHERVMSLGARVLQEAAPSDAADRFQVYADPAGHPFCLCWFV